MDGGAKGRRRIQSKVLFLRFLSMNSRNVFDLWDNFLDSVAISAAVSRCEGNGSYYVYLAVFTLFRAMAFIPALPGHNLERRFHRFIYWFYCRNAHAVIRCIEEKPKKNREKNRNLKRNQRHFAVSAVQQPSFYEIDDGSRLFAQIFISARYFTICVPILEDIQSDHLRSRASVHSTRTTLHTTSHWQKKWSLLFYVKGKFICYSLKSCRKRMLKKILLFFYGFLASEYVLKSFLIPVDPLVLPPIKTILSASSFKTQKLPLQSWTEPTEPCQQRDIFRERHGRFWCRFLELQIFPNWPKNSHFRGKIWKFRNSRIMGFRILLYQILHAFQSPPV